MKNLKMLTTGALLISGLMLTGCVGTTTTTGGGGGGGGSTAGYYSSASATATQFTNALNNVDFASGSYVELYEDETYRTFDEGIDEWFVIYDDKYNEYKAVSLQYVRSIVYYDYMSNTDSLASEFRYIEDLDISSGELNGDYYGDDYEVVDYDGWTDSFWGRNSGWEYEDESETTDVNLMAAESEEMKFFQKASAVSYEFSVSLPTAMSLVTLGTKVSSMTKTGELSIEDMSALSQDIEKITGVNTVDFLTTSQDASARKENLEKAAKKLGTTPLNLEQKLLPGLFGMNI